MSQRIEDGGAAFPRVVGTKFDARSGVPIEQDVCPGMSLRDHFAGQALVPILASAGNLFERRRGAELRNAIAETAYAIADAMLAARQMGAQTGGEAHG